MGEQPEWELWLSVGGRTKLRGLGTQRRCGSSTGASRCKLRRRLSYAFEEHTVFGNEAAAFRDTFFEEQGHIYGWMIAFLQHTFPLIESWASPAGKAAKNQVRGAVRTSRGWKEKERSR